MKEKISFFDVDHTIIRCVSAVAFFRVCVARKIIRPYYFVAVPFLFLFYRFFHIHVESIYNYALQFLKGIPRDEIREIAHEAYMRYMQKSLNQRILQEIAGLQKNGVRIMIATSAPVDFVADIAAVCGIPETDIIATNFLYKDGICAGSLIGKAAFGAEKREAAAAVLRDCSVSPGDCSFYSDSIHDLPLFLYVGRPVAVFPDGRLRSIANRRHWTIIE